MRQKVFPVIHSTTTSRPAGLAAWLRVLVIALLVALAVPAIAMADEGSAGGTATAEQPAATDGSATTDETATPAEQPAATDEQAPPAAEEQQQPVAEEPAPATTDPAPAEQPVAEQPAPQEPQAPPTASEPAPTAPTPPPATSGGSTVINIPLPVIDLPEIQLPLPTIPEVLPGEPPAPADGTAAPAPGVGELIPVLIAPEAPRPPSIGTIAPTEPPKATIPDVTVPTTATTGSAQATGVVTPFDLGGPPSLTGADPISEASRTAVDGAAAFAAASVPLRGGLISLDPSRGAGPSGPVVAGGGSSGGPVVFGAKGATAEIAAPQLVSPAGPAPAQSLLAVLASYILPGSGPVPAGTVFLLVMLGVILLAAYAPRPGGSERIWLSGLVGPRSGHGLAVRRPG